MPIEDANLSLQGIWIGDAFGASLSSSSKAAISVAQRTLPEAPWRWTDNTQMALAVLEELGANGWIDQDSLARRLARGYRAAPARGYDRNTAQTLQRIAMGEYFRPASRTQFQGDIFDCAALTRSVPVGGYYAGNPVRAGQEARLSAAVTTLQQEGVAGAEAVAAAAALAAQEGVPVGAGFLKGVVRFVPESKVREGIVRSLEIPKGDLERAVRELGAGKNRTAQDAVPFALWCAAHHLDDFEEALWQAAYGLGLLDTLCAIVGGVVVLANRRFNKDWAGLCEPLPTGFTDGKEEILREVDPLFLTQNEKRGLSLNDFPYRQIDIRDDTLTGLPNLVALLNWAKERSEQDDFSPFSLIAIHLLSLSQLNREKGTTAGDELLKWCARLLREQRPGLIFRAGGDKFAILTNSADFKENTELAVRLAEIVDVERVYPGLRPARSAIVHFSQPESLTPGKLLACLFVALSDAHELDTGGYPVVAWAESILQLDPDFPWMLLDLADQVLRMGHTADETLRLANVDSVSQLPNMRAAMCVLDKAVDSARVEGNPLAVLLIDGDNLRQYNQISYEAGDEVIRLLGTTLQRAVRQSDFLARWRVGDEFLVLMPDTPLHRAQEIGQRLCQVVAQVSASWIFPSTVSIGIAVFPDHGSTVQGLIRAAERGLYAAKKLGKNQVCSCDENTDIAPIP